MTKKQPIKKTFDVTFEVTDKEFSINTLTTITYDLKDFMYTLKKLEKRR